MAYFDLLDIHKPFSSKVKKPKSGLLCGLIYVAYSYVALFVTGVIIMFILSAGFVSFQ